MSLASPKPSPVTADDGRRGAERELAHFDARYASGTVGFTDFDRYVEEHGIPEEHYPAAFALWYAEATGEPVPSFEKVERAKEHPQIEGDDLWPAALLPNLADSA